MEKNRSRHFSSFDLKAIQKSSRSDFQKALGQKPSKPNKKISYYLSKDYSTARSRWGSSISQGTGSSHVRSASELLGDYKEQEILIANRETKKAKVAT